MIRFALLCPAGIALTLASPIAHAETGVDMLLAPWDWKGGQTAALDVWAGNATSQDKTSGEKVALRYTEIQGRVHTEDTPFMVGWQAKFLGFGTADRPAVPRMMHDTGLSVVTSLTPDDPAEAFGRDWNIALEAGAGQASTAFSDSRGLYGTATVTAATDFSDTSRLTVGVSYDGNRALWQDLPLVGFEYREASEACVDPDGKKPVFAWRVGFPRLGFDWRPDARWLVSVKADITSLGSALVEYGVTKKTYVFGQFRPYRIRVHAEDDDANRRLFFSSDTAEVGLRFTPRGGAHFLGAIGYSFNQVLERGWDVRGLHTVREFDPALMLRGEVRWDF